MGPAHCFLVGAIVVCYPFGINVSFQGEKTLELCSSISAEDIKCGLSKLNLFDLVTLEHMHNYREICQWPLCNINIK